MYKRLFLYTDGGSRNNPGQAAIGAVLMNKEKVLKTLSQKIGIATNNEAEYTALIEGLKAAAQYKPSELTCYMDSDLVVKQITGKYRIKEPRLQKLCMEAKNLEKSLGAVNYKYIPRKDNSLADSLVNTALDA